MNNFVDKNALSYLFEEIDKNIKAKCYYSALLLSLSIPDALGKLKYPTIEYSSERYARWFDENVKDLFGLLPNDAFYKERDIPCFSGLVCYQLRCKLYHEGHNDIEKKTGINEFVLSMTDEEFVRGKNASNDIDYDNIWHPTEVIKEVKYLYVSCKGLSLQIVRAAKAFIENNPNLDYPTIRINYGGGRINKFLFV